jgi:membrane fusion protein (multidrug efflux system)
MSLKPKQKALAIAGGGAVVLVAAYLIFNAFTYVGTDNAQIGAHVILLSSRVNGTIKTVQVEENQKVKAGDVLAQIDTSDFSNASEAAEAAVSSLQARAREAEVNYRRAVGLFKSQAVSREMLDNAEASYKDAAAKLKASQAQAEQATLNVSYTRIVAPADGTVARKSVEPGQFVGPGTPLFGFVSSRERWVIANLKETEIAGVIPGRHVKIEVDALPGRDFEGEVESISPSTGAVFSLLPPDNSTGNFTKVVQRVPVRIRMPGLSVEDIDQLHAGLSATASIRIR